MATRLALSEPSYDQILVLVTSELSSDSAPVLAASYRLWPRRRTWGSGWRVVFVWQIRVPVAFHLQGRLSWPRTGRLELVVPRHGGTLSVWGIPTASGLEDPGTANLLTGITTGTRCRVGKLGPWLLSKWLVLQQMQSTGR